MNSNFAIIYTYFILKKYFHLNIMTMVIYNVFYHLIKMFNYQKLIRKDF